MASPPLALNLRSLLFTLYGDALLPPAWVGGAAGAAFLDSNARLRRPAERFSCTIAAEATIVDNGDRGGN